MPNSFFFVYIYAQWIKDLLLYNRPTGVSSSMFNKVRGWPYHLKLKLYFENLQSQLITFRKFYFLLDNFKFLKKEIVSISFLYLNIFALAYAILWASWLMIICMSEHLFRLNIFSFSFSRSSILSAKTYLNNRLGLQMLKGCRSFSETVKFLTFSGSDRSSRNADLRLFG